MYVRGFHRGIMSTDLDVQMEDLTIEAEENEELCLDDELIEESNKFELCLVGKFLTEKTST